MRTEKIRDLLVAVSGAAFITLVTSATPVKAVDMFQSREVMVGSVIQLPDLVATGNQSSNDEVKKNDIMSFVENLGEITDVIAPASIIFAALTYFFNAKWKRRQYADEMIKAFEEQPETINVRKTLSTELQCVELFPFVTEPIERFVFIKDEVWAEALLESKCNKRLEDEHKKIDRSKPLYEQDPAIKSAIRDNFNRFLDHLQHFEKMIESKTVKESDIRSYLNVWIRLIYQVDEKPGINCPVSNLEYSLRRALLEYMGLIGDPQTTIQKDVNLLIRRYLPNKDLDELQPRACHQLGKLGLPILEKN